MNRSMVMRFTYVADPVSAIRKTATGVQEVMRRVSARRRIRRALTMGHIGSVGNALKVCNYPSRRLFFQRKRISKNPMQLSLFV
jgi:hypothetical protein